MADGQTLLDAFKALPEPERLALFRQLIAGLTPEQAGEIAASALQASEIPATGANIGKFDVNRYSAAGAGTCVAVTCWHKDELYVALVSKTNDPMLYMPGGYINVAPRGEKTGPGQDDTIQQTAARSLKREIGFEIKPEQLTNILSVTGRQYEDQTCGRMGIHTYYAATLFDQDDLPHLKAGGDIAEVTWVRLKDISASKFENDEFGNTRLDGEHAGKQIIPYHLAAINEAARLALAERFPKQTVLHGPVAKSRIYLGKEGQELVETLLKEEQQPLSPRAKNFATRAKSSNPSALRGSRV